jgi:nucleoside-diphosphate-sugar epimerase
MMNNSLTGPASARLQIGVVGAGGFVGARFIEMARCIPRLSVIPIVRSYKALARLKVDSEQCRIVDTTNRAALREAFKDCRAVVNLTSGDPTAILNVTKALYEASADSGADIFVQVSSAVVFGRVVQDGISDDSPAVAGHWSLYAREKIRAERMLKQRMIATRPKVIVLRPGLIWGPGSVYSRTAAEELMTGRAFLCNSGRGICNLVYVDNLVRSILAVCECRNPKAGFYNVADPECITWRGFYTATAEKLGYSPKRLCLLDTSPLRFSAGLLIEWAMNRRLLFRLQKWLLGRLGPEAKAIIKARLKRYYGPRSGPPTDIEARAGGAPAFTREQWSLQNTVHPLPVSKFQQAFGPVEFSSFAENISQTALWLRFAGFGPRDTSAPGTQAHSANCQGAVEG